MLVRASCLRRLRNCSFHIHLFLCDWLHFQNSSWSAAGRCDGCRRAAEAGAEGEAVSRADGQGRGPGKVGGAASYSTVFDGGAANQEATVAPNRCSLFLNGRVDGRGWQQQDRCCQRDVGVRSCAGRQYGQARDEERRAWGSRAQSVGPSVAGPGAACSATAGRPAGAELGRCSWQGISCEGASSAACQVPPTLATARA